MRRVAARLWVVFLLAVFLAFALANRQKVALSLDLFSFDVSGSVLEAPLFLLMSLSFLFGFALGGLTQWLRGGGKKRGEGGGAGE